MNGAATPEPGQGAQQVAQPLHLSGQGFTAPVRGRPCSQVRWVSDGSTSHAVPVSAAAAAPRAARASLALQGWSRPWRPCTAASLHCLHCLLEHAAPPAGPQPAPSCQAGVQPSTGVSRPTQRGGAQLEGKLQQQWRGLEAAREGSLKHRLYRHEHSLLGAAGLGSLSGSGRSSRPAFSLVPCCPWHESLMAWGLGAGIRWQGSRFRRGLAAAAPPCP